jgi:hypothetical protein
MLLNNAAERSSYVFGDSSSAEMKEFGFDFAPSFGRQIEAARLS